MGILLSSRDPCKGELAEASHTVRFQQPQPREILPAGPCSSHGGPHCFHDDTG